MRKRPNFSEVAKRLELMIQEENGGTKKKKSIRRISNIIDRHSTWF